MLGEKPYSSVDAECILALAGNRANICVMRSLLVILVLAATPLAAQDSEEQGIDLMSEALKLFMRGLMQEMEPAMEGMEGLLEDLSAYHPPEILPNGDIIIRRKTPVDRGPDDESGEVEL
jgi:hypothetical protein